METELSNKVIITYVTLIHSAYHGYSGLVRCCFNTIANIIRGGDSKKLDMFNRINAGEWYHDDHGSAALYENDYSDYSSRKGRLVDW